MSKMKKEDVERIAVGYAERLGVKPFVMDGSEYFEDRVPPYWNVYFSFRESPEDEIGLPHFFVIHVDDATGGPSHIASL